MDVVDDKDNKDQDEADDTPEGVLARIRKKVHHPSTNYSVITHCPLSPSTTHLQSHCFI